MSRHEIVARITEEGAIAVIRMSDTRRLMKVAEAVLKGGISSIEITMTTPGALEVVQACSKEMGDAALIGVGSVLDAETARLAILAGARYVVSPVFVTSVIEMAHRYDVPAMPGALTPTEIFRASEAGADIVKIFPADMFGMSFFKSVKAPMPHLNLMPSGGVTLTNGGDWIKAGACAVGVGSALLDKKAIAAGKFDVLTENARTLRASISAGQAAQ